MNDQLRSAIEAALSVNEYSVDANGSHLRVKELETCRQCADRPCILICPAAVYAWQNDTLTIQYAGCLECAACRFVCPHDNIDWNYPRGGFGVRITKG